MGQVVFLWGGWEPLLRIIIVGSLSYISLIFLLRVAGKRSLAQLNAFDLVVTIALGSTFGRLMTAQRVSLAESITAFLTLILSQYIVSWLTVHSARFKNLMTADPCLLYFRGDFISKTMKAQRVTQAQLVAAVRSQGMDSLQNVEAIVMESSGRITVIRQESDRHTQESYSVLTDVKSI